MTCNIIPLLRAGFVGGVLTFAAMVLIWLGYQIIKDMVDSKIRKAELGS